MWFSDEFEFKDSNGNTFYVAVEGNKSADEYGAVFTHVSEIRISDSNDEIVDADNPSYDEIIDEVNNREYEVELHSVDFDYYESNLEKLYLD